MACLPAFRAQAKGMNGFDYQQAWLNGSINKPRAFAADGGMGEKFAAGVQSRF
jgi:hypothetical protein